MSNTPPVTVHGEQISPSAAEKFMSTVVAVSSAAEEEMELSPPLPQGGACEYVILEPHSWWNGDAEKTTPAPSTSFDKTLICIMESSRSSLAVTDEVRLSRRRNPEQQLAPWGEGFGLHFLLKTYNFNKSSHRTEVFEPSSKFVSAFVRHFQRGARFKSDKLKGLTVRMDN